MRITELIPYGHDNAITRTELEMLTGFPDRVIRREINLADDLIINLLDGKGYFKPLPEEIKLVEEWEHLTWSRIRNEMEKTKKAKEWKDSALMCELMCPEPEEN